jgi:hypothetical protein
MQSKICNDDRGRAASVGNIDRIYVTFGEESCMLQAATT